jgi:hypothetical protein
MSVFSPPPQGQLTLDQQTQEVLAGDLAAAWQ